VLALGDTVVPGSLSCSPEHGAAWRHVHCILAVEPATVTVSLTPTVTALLLTAYVEAGRDSTTKLWRDPLHPDRGWNDVVQP